MSKRCSCFANTTSHICRKKFSFIILDKKFCHIHAKYEFNKYVILIQKHLKGYRTRCMMVNVYTKLPDDLQQKIIFYVRENYLIKKHHNDVISKILDAKLDRVWFLSVINSLTTSNGVKCKNLDTLAHIYYLFTKYFTIAPQTKLMLLKNSTRLLKNSIYDLRYSELVYDNLYSNNLLTLLYSFEI